MAPEKSYGSEAMEAKPKQNKNETGTKAPEDKENPETVLLRKVYSEIDQKLKDAMDFATTNRRERGQVLKDFAGDAIKGLSDKGRELLEQKKPVFLYPYKESPSSPMQAYLVTFEKGVCVPVETRMSDSFAEPGDAYKTPLAGPERKDRPVNDLLNDLEQKARDARVHFDNNVKGSANQFQKTLNAFISDCYSRFTISEKALLQNKKISINVMIGGVFSDTPWRSTITCYGNNYSITSDPLE